LIDVPERAFLALAVPLGLAFALALPPGAAPDEGPHLGRVWTLLDGRWLPPGPARPAPIPSSIAGLHRTINEGAPRTVIRRSVGATLALATAPLEPERTRLLVGVSPYSPLPYAPAAAAVALGRAIGAPPGVLVWLARAANLAAFLALAAFAIRVCPVRRWTLVLLALLPMSLAMAASVSADAVTFGVALLFVAVAMRAALASGRLASSELAGLLAAAVALGLVKSGVQPLAAAALAIPAARCGGAGRWLALLAGIGLAVAVPLGLWLVALEAAGSPPLTEGADPAAQLRHVLADPFGLLRVLASTTAIEIGLWWRSFVGVFGPATTWLPAPFYPAWAVVLVGVAFADGPQPAVLGWARRAALAFGFAVAALAVLVTAYLGWNPVGATHVLGVQGRYFLPFAPALLLALPSRDRPLPAPWRLAVLAFAAATGLAAILAILTRYYTL
jgi:uncharacterized membrane protein